MPGLSSIASYPWQARTVDSLGVPCPWVSFGRNAETAADSFGPSYPDGLFTPGATYTLTATFADGSTATASATVP